MKTRFFLFIALVVALCVGSTDDLSAQRRGTDANIHGHIIHAQTREHIPFVTITVKDTTIGLVADASGHFFLKNLPVGEHTIVAEAIGLETVEQTVRMEAGKTIELNFEMKDATHTMDEVVVSATRNETNKK
ncbi:MAG: carboxypeptidase-like regulatory domain-containing protein, partial [Alistipes sp.]|nr:carboxypeptidase-like regulatory domain-containing protein [Alistipes sp.]